MSHDQFTLKLSDSDSDVVVDVLPYLRRAHDHDQGSAAVHAYVAGTEVREELVYMYEDYRGGCILTIQVHACMIE